MGVASTIEPFKIAVPDEALKRLRAKLQLATLPGPTDFSDDPNYGAALSDIERLVGYWRDKYDWRRAEADLNSKLPQFTTTVAVDGHGDFKIHFVHQKSERQDSIPLLFCHGWPGSFLEVIKILPLLTCGAKEDEPSFHVVAPSLPNYGFSQRTSKPGFAPPQYAEVCHKLMLQLGYQQYVTQGGDWGFYITRVMGSLYPSHVLASHMNFIVAQPSLRTPLLLLQYLTGRYTAAEKAGLERSKEVVARKVGYLQIQSTRPHTPGFGVADSPVGLLAWIHEKLRDWTDAYPWTEDEVLTWVSIYLFSDAGPDASFRIYYETAQSDPDGVGLANPQSTIFPAWTGTPLGLSYFPKDVAVLPSSWGRTLGPVVFERRHEKGGHFASYEEPELLVDDVRKTVRNAKIAS